MVNWFGGQKVGGKSISGEITNTIHTACPFYFCNPFSVLTRPANPDQQLNACVETIVRGGSHIFPYTCYCSFLGGGGFQLILVEGNIFEIIVGDMPLYPSFRLLYEGIACWIKLGYQARKWTRAHFGPGFSFLDNVVCIAFLSLNCYF